MSPWFVLDLVVYLLMKTPFNRLSFLHGAERFFHRLYLNVCGENLTPKRKLRKKSLIKRFVCPWSGKFKCRLYRRRTAFHFFLLLSNKWYVLYDLHMAPFSLIRFILRSQTLTLAKHFLKKALFSLCPKAIGDAYRRRDTVRHFLRLDGFHIRRLNSLSIFYENRFFLFSKRLKFCRFLLFPVLIKV